MNSPSARPDEIAPESKALRGNWSFGIVIAALSGFMAVALGAFGAHGLKSGLLVGLADAPKRLEWWETAVDYQMWHSLLFVAVAASGLELTARTRKWLLIWMLSGLLLFSGSLYVMTLTGFRALGAITPLGGTSFLALWALVARTAWRRHVRATDSTQAAGGDSRDTTSQSPNHRV